MDGWTVVLDLDLLQSGMHEENRKCPPLQILSFTNNSGCKNCLTRLKAVGKNGYILP